MPEMHPSRDTQKKERVAHGPGDAMRLAAAWRERTEQYAITMADWQ